MITERTVPVPSLEPPCACDYPVSPAREFLSISSFVPSEGLSHCGGYPNVGGGAVQRSPGANHKGDEGMVCS